MKAIVTLLAVISISWRLNAQVVQEVWRQYDSTSTSSASDSYRTIAADANGGVYVCGTFNGNNTMVHYDSSGQVLWQVYFESNGIEYDYVDEMILSQSGYLFVVGGVYEFSTKYNGFIACVDTAGTIMWEHVWDGAFHGDDALTDLVELPNGNIVACGSAQSGISRTDAILHLYSPNGILISQHQYTSNSSISTGITSLNDVLVFNGNQIIACGSFDDSTFREEAWILSYNFPLTTLNWEATWHYQTSSQTNNDHYSVMCTDNAFIYVGGAQSSSNSVVQQFDGTGNMIWSTRRIGLEDVSDIITDGTGNCYASMQNTIVTSENFRLEKFNNTGSLSWSYEYIPSITSYDHCEKLVMDANGNVYMIGQIQTAANGRQHTVLQVTPAGTLGWLQFQQGTIAGPSNYAYDVVVANNNIYVSGVLYNGGSLTDAVVTRYTLNGTHIRTDTAASRGNTFTDPIMTTDLNGNIYTAGLVPSGVMFVKRDANGILLWESLSQIPNVTGVLPRRLQVDAMGNLYMLSLGTQTGTGGDAILSKYDPNGIFMWHSYQNGSYNGNDQPGDLLLDSLGYIYMGAELYTSFGRSEVVLAKYSPNGGLIWSSTFGGNDTIGQTTPGQILLDGQETVYFAYTGRDTIQGEEMVLTKLDSAGVLSWSRDFNRMTNHPDHGSYLALLADHSIGIAGLSADTINGADIAIVRYDQSGNFLWNYQFHGTDTGDNDIPAGLQSDGQNFFVCGYESSNNNHVFFVGCVDSSGFPIWNHSFGLGNVFDGEAYSIAYSPSQNVVAATGYVGIHSDLLTVFIEATSGSIIDSIYTGCIDNDKGTTVLARPDGFLVNGWMRYNAAANIIGATIKYCVGPITSVTTVFADTICINSGLIPLVGNPTGGIFSGVGVNGNSFDPSIAGVGYIPITYTSFSATCNVSQTIIVYVDSCLWQNMSELSTGSWRCYPNPAEGEIYFESPLDYSDPIQIAIYDSRGELVSMEVFGSHTTVCSMTLGTLEQGMYTAQVISGYFVSSVRFIVSR